MGSDKKKKDGDKKKPEIEVKPTKVIELKVGLHCKKCVQKILSSLTQMRGVSRIDTDLEKNKVTVTGTVEEKEIVKKIGKLGKIAEPWKESSKSKSAAASAAAAGLKFTIKEDQPGIKLVVVQDQPSNCALM